MYTITIEETGLDSPKLLIKLQGQDVSYYGDNFGELLDAMSEYLGPYCSIED